jgi:hypothetical protein
MNEGSEAFDRFRDAVKAVIGVPKNALPAKPTRQKQKPAKRKP